MGDLAYTTVGLVGPVRAAVDEWRAKADFAGPIRIVVDPYPGATHVLIDMEFPDGARRYGGLEPERFAEKAFTHDEVRLYTLSLLDHMKASWEARRSVAAGAR